MSGFGRVEDAVAALRRGELVLVVDDEDRENEGDLIGAAQHMDAATMSFLLRHTSGIVCVAIDEPTAQRLDLPPMVTANTDPHGTAFTVSVDAAPGTPVGPGSAITTGISPADRAATVRVLADPAARPADLARPGHVFPLVARSGGVLVRGGHTEAGIDLVRLAGLAPAAVLSEVVDEDGNPARRPALLEFAARHGLVAITIRTLQEHLRAALSRIELVSAQLPTRWGEFTAHGFTDPVTGHEHIVLTLGTWTADDEVPVRVHSECLTGDVLGSQRCDCGDQLDLAMRRIVRHGAGVLVYLRGHEGRGIGLTAKIAAYALQEHGLDTVDANTALGFPVDARSFDAAADVLHALGVHRVGLLTHNPGKVAALRARGLQVRPLPLPLAVTEHNDRYLRTKRDRLGHLLGTTTA
jgi:GTP cyclohydrolase II/3,4-dihydroxy-2-butanone 4-phosphate synthase